MLIGHALILLNSRAQTDFFSRETMWRSVWKIMVPGFLPDIFPSFSPSWMCQTSCTAELISLAILTSVKTRNKWTVLTLSCYFYQHFVLFYFGFSFPLISAKSNISCLTGSYILIHIRNRKQKMWKQTVPGPHSKSGSWRTVGLFASFKSSPKWCWY